MLFWGRSLDTFESALVMLNGGALIHRDIDCISGRSFCLDHERADRLFSCVLPLEDAIRSINIYTDNSLKLIDPRQADGEFVMELKSDIGVPAIFRKYYPFGHYIFCCRKGNTVYVNDPDGFPVLSYSADIFPFESLAVIKTDGNTVLSIDREAVLKRIRMFLNSNRSSVIPEISGKVFLQYALRNYACHTNKILSCICGYIQTSETLKTELKQLISRMLSTNYFSSDEIYHIDEKIHCLLEEAVC